MTTAVRTVLALALATALAIGCSYIGGRQSQSPSSPIVITSPSPSPTASQDPTQAPELEGFVAAEEAQQLIRQCGIGGEIAAYFRIPEGNDYHDHFPHAGKAPEIEGLSGLFVVVYDGPVTGLILGGPGASRGPLTDALCIVGADGYPNVYGGVSRDGMVLPAGATLEPDSPFPTLPPTPEAGESSAPTPNTTDAALEFRQSVLFWDALISGEQPDTIASLRQAVKRSDLIIVGRFTGLRFGDMVGGFEVTRATLAIDEVLKGEPQTLTPGSITLQALPVTDRDAITAIMPMGRQLLFLHYVPWELERLGLPPDDQQRELYDYVTVNGTEGVLLEIDGKARSFDPRNPARFPVMYEGEAFDVVVDETRDLAAER